MSANAEAPGCHPALAAISAVRDLLSELTDQPVWTMSERQLPGAVAAAVSLVAQAQSVLVAMVGEADARKVAATIGSPSTVSWLRARHKLHPGDAAQLVRTAAGFRDGSLPATQSALAAGKISLPHAHGIRRACADLPDYLDPDLAATVEAAMVQDARDFDPVVAGRLARYAITRIDPDGEDKRDGERLARAEKRAAANNQLAFTPDGEGGIFIRGRVDADGHAIIDTALQSLMQPRPTTSEGPDLRTTGRRRAEALVEICRRMLATGDLPSHGGSKPQVVVTIPLKTLTHEVGVGLLPTGEPISPAAARHWACDAGIIPAVLDSSSRPLDIADEKRLFEGRLRRAVEIRDGGCTHPGCDRPISWCEGHHIRSWAVGGKTTLANGVLLCRYHHRNIEDGDWEVWIHTDGFPVWRPPPWVDSDRRLTRNYCHRPELPLV